MQQSIKFTFKNDHLCCKVIFKTPTSSTPYQKHHFKTHKEQNFLKATLFISETVCFFTTTTVRLLNNFLDTGRS